MNKKNLKTVIIILSISLMAVFQSCEKKEIVDIEDEKIENTDNIYVKNGMLVFQNQEVYDEYINKVVSQTREEREAWEQSLGFTSMATIFDKINDAEIALEEKLYAGYDEDLSKEELKNLGLPVDLHSDMYNKYINKGIIKENIEQDGSESFNLSVIGEESFINEEGLMVINDTIYRYTSTQIQILTDGNYEKIYLLLKTQSNDLENNIVVFNVADKSTNWSKSSGWKYEGSKKRYRMDVKGWSWTYSNHKYMGSRYSVEGRAERKRWGKWKQRNSYTPIKKIIGNWNFKYTMTPYWYGGYPRQTYYSISDNDRKSPVSYTFGHVNNFTFYLSPNGNWYGGSRYFAGNGIYMMNYSFTGYFDPGNIKLSK